MKKLTSLLLAMMMVMTLVPCTSFATEKKISLSETYVNPVYQDVITEGDLKKPSDSGISTYSTPRYFTEESQIAEVLREGMTQRQDVITINYIAPEQLQSGYLGRWIELACEETGNPKQGDYLRWHYGGASSGGYYIPDEEGYKYTLDIALTYYTTNEQEEVVDQAVANLITELNITDAMSDYQKLCAFYDYVCANVTYDNDNLENAEYKLKFSAYAALIDKAAVCQGYANLMYRLMSEVGVSCRIITGNAGGPHGWNIVKLGDKYYLIDATWDAPRKTAGVAYEYFVKGTDDFSRDHTANDEYMTAEFQKTYPISSTDYVPCNHQWETEYTIDKEATCDKDGSKSYHCELCDVIQPGSSVVIEALGHSYSAVAIEPTCTEGGYTTYTCDCGYSYVGDEVAAQGHTYTTEVVAPTCTSIGYTIYTCECGDAYTSNEVAMLKHTEEELPAVEATCVEVGLTAGAMCSVCGEITVQQEEIPMKDHTYGNWIIEKEASCETAGEKYRVCTTCGDKDTDKIPAINVVKLSYSSTTYNGSVKKPSVKVTDTAGNALKAGTDYSVTYATGRKNVGKYKVTISFKGNYGGKSVSKEFKINPKGVGISKLTKAKKSFKVSWKKPSSTYRKQMTGYQIRYSTKSNMSSAKTATVKSTTATSKTIKSLKAKKKYYVQIRTYKTVKGVKYYSAWSARKSVKTK